MDFSEMGGGHNFVSAGHDRALLEETGEAISSLSTSQQRILSSLSMPSALLSILGSTLIIIRVIRCRLYKNSPYNRLMLALSASDIISSFSAGFGVFLLPQATSDRIWARGNETTCNLLGFLTQLAIGAIWYNGLLSMYYLLTVRFGIKREVFAQKYELWFHLSAILFFFGTATVPLVLGMYGENELSASCWIQGSDLIGMIFGAVPLLLVFFGLPMSNLLIYCHVRKTVKGQIDTVNDGAASMKRKGLPTTTTATTIEDKVEGEEEEIGDASGVRQFSSEWQELQQDRVREVAQQGFFYVAFFYVSYLPTFLVGILDGFVLNEEDRADFFWLLAINSVLLPLQGWFNLLKVVEYSIYMRPNYTRVRNVCPEMGIWWAMKVAWWERKLPTLQQAHSIRRSTAVHQHRQRKQATATADRPSFKEHAEIRSQVPTEVQADEFTNAFQNLQSDRSHRQRLEKKNFGQGGTGFVSGVPSMCQAFSDEVKLEKNDDPYFCDSIPSVEEDF